MITLAVLSNGAAGLNATTCPTEVHTVSGISSGGSMAMIHAISRSSCVSGVAVVAGATYGCNALLDTCSDACADGPCQCQTAHQYIVDAYLLQRARAGVIDDLYNVRGMKAWLFSGTEDSVVRTCVMKHVERQMEALGADVTTVFNVFAQHCWLIDGRTTGPSQYVDKCGDFCSYVEDCQYDMARAIFSNQYGAVRPPAFNPDMVNNLVKVHLAAYLPASTTAEGIGLGRFALAYVPSACYGMQAWECSIHVRYHGCGSGVTTMSEFPKFFYDDMPFLAESNGIIVLYPQAVAAGPNTEGCWDWTGYYDDPNFDTHSGPQMRTILAMISGLRGMVNDEATVWDRPLAGRTLEEVLAFQQNSTASSANAIVV